MNRIEKSPTSVMRVHVMSVHLDTIHATVYVISDLVEMRPVLTLEHR